MPSALLLAVARPAREGAAIPSFQCINAFPLVVLTQLGPTNTLLWVAYPAGGVQ